jgi:ABC-type proline/glycine betaine transport system ATPase subunit
LRSVGKEHFGERGVIQSGKPTIYYEFKSVKEIKDSYITQFIKDLKRSDVNDLSQIQWIFDHDKMSTSQVKEKFLAALEKNKTMLQTITASKANQILLRNDLSDNTNNDKIEIAEEIINYLKIHFYDTFK